MQRLLLLFLCVAGFGLLNAQVVLEDFEGGEADLPWNAYEGTFAVVENPIDTVVITTPNSTSNTSAFVGSYTKAGDKTFSFFVAELTEPLDLSTNNQISIQIYAGAATRLLMKLEQRNAAGAAQFIQGTVNIPTANVWRTYTFDFSGAAELDSLNNIILFFDPGVETSADTYLFDNLIASPAGPCAGTEVNPTVLDDFECQRNATYGLGYDDLIAIANPDMSGINMSASVGQYTDRDGGFHALVIDYNSPIDLSENNYLCMKVWVPVAGDILFKLEGGTVYEQRVTVAQTSTWVEVCVDLSAQANRGNNKIVLFFNVEVEEAAGDVYYIDDITLTPAPAPEAIEDFEDGARLNWNTAGGDNGTFDGAIANPDMDGNDSETVGAYTRGSALFAALNANFNDGIDLTGAPQLNLDVWSPAAGTTVTLQLSSPTAGRVSATATGTAASTWETLSFNFEEFEDVTDFESLTLLFAPNTTGTDTYYFDNLTAGSATVDACADVEVNMTILDDFECQRNATYAGGSEFLSAIDNPDGATGSGNTSPTVGAFADQPGSFNALVIDFTDPIDLRLNNQLSVDIWAPVAGQILFKLEGGSSAAVEIFQDIPETDSWNTYTVDLSSYEDMGYTRLVLFFGAGVENTAVNTYYIDDLRLSRAPYVSGCVSTFDDVDYSVVNWTAFQNGSLNDASFAVVENPLVSDANMSAFVGSFTEAADGGATFAGIAAALDAPIALPTNAKTLSIKVFSTEAQQFVMKLEGGLDSVPNTSDLAAEYTTPGAWQTLTFDASMIPDGARYGRLVIIPNIMATPTANLITYFDDISVGGGNCADLTGLFAPVSIAALRVYPNPITNQLTIENPAEAVRFTLTNMLGQQVRELRIEGAQTQVQWELGDLERGAYLVTARDRAGRVLARSVAIKR